MRLLGCVKADRVQAFLEGNPELAQGRGAHGIPILFYAAIAGDEAIAQLLLDAGADVNAGAGGNTALHGAAAFGKTHMAAWLLERRADVSARDYQGKTALGVALQDGHRETAELRRQHGGME